MRSFSLKLAGQACVHLPQVRVLFGERNVATTQLVMLSRRAELFECPQPVPCGPQALPRLYDLVPHDFLGR
jgi:hypothetical protein